MTSAPRRPKGKSRPKAKSPKMKIFSLRLDAALRKGLDKLAERRGEDAAVIVRALLRRELRAENLIR